MRLGLLGLGILLFIVGLVFSTITLGVGILCSWPLLVIGLILIILGILLPIRL